MPRRPLTWRALMDTVEQIDQRLRRILKIPRLPATARAEVADTIEQLTEPTLERNGRRERPRDAGRR